MQELKDKLIVALDVGSLKDAEQIVDRLFPPGVKIFKVGSQLFTACGPDAVRMVGSKGARVFLDLKWYDIDNTVSNAVVSGTGVNCETTSFTMASAQDSLKKSITYPVFMMTVHIRDNEKTLKAAVKSAADKANTLGRDKPFIIGVTRLTSDADRGNIQKEVFEAAKLAKESGLDGVVCSVHEAEMIRKEFGKNFLIVTPGIRPKGAPVDDQARKATFSQAVKAGADYIVVGRPILEADDPVEAMQEILKS